jgi:hypothetical protein
MPPRRFTPAEISAFDLELARGAKQVDVARKHGFSPSNFRRWFAKYGRLHIPYEPTDADRARARARAWRQGKTLAQAWTMFREFAKTRAWALDADLPVFDDSDERPDSDEHLQLKAWPDARVVLVCEKMLVEKLLWDWEGAKRPSVAHATRTTLAFALPLASRWVAHTLHDHAKSLGAKLAFFGDLDPHALHAFAALRAGGRKALLRGTGKTLPVSWLGLDSRWLDWICRAFGVTDVPVGMTLRLKWVEQEYWQLVKRLVPDVGRLIGPRAYAMLDGGTKLEVDALQARWFVEGIRRRRPRVDTQPFLEELGRRLRLAGASAPP